MTTAEPKSTVDMLYDYAGRRIAKAVDGALGYSRLTPAPDYEITEFAKPDATATTPRQTIVYITGPDGVVAQWTDSAAPTDSATVGAPAGLVYLHRNRIGSVNRLSDAAALVGSEIVYTPLGEIVKGDPPTGTRRLFTGQEYDAETGLYYFQSRYYHPRLGSFIQPDDRPGGPLDCGDVYNRYAYALHRPFTFVDPSGHGIADIFDKIGLGFLNHGAWKPVVMFSLSIGMVAGGIGISMLTAGGAGMLGSALMGAGINGCVYTATGLTTHQELSYDAWAVQLGIGAATGLIAGAGASYTNVCLEGITDAFVRIGTQAVYGGIAGAVAGATGTILQNVAHGVSWDSGLAQGFLLGGAVGAAGSMFGEAAAIGWASRASTIKLTPLSQALADVDQGAARTLTDFAAIRQVFDAEALATRKLADAAANYSGSAFINKMMFTSATGSLGGGIAKSTLQIGSGIAKGLLMPG